MDPTNNKMYALISAAITGVVTCIVAFLNISGEQKAAIMAAASVCGSLVAYIFVSSHQANVVATATTNAAVISNTNVPENHPAVALARQQGYAQGRQDEAAARPK